MTGGVLTTAYRAAALRLLRRLAGRLDDGVRAAARSYLGAGETELLEDTLLAELAAARVGLDPQERADLRAMLTDPDDWRLADLPGPDGGRPAPRYRFVAGPAPAADVEGAVLDWAGRRPGVRRLLRAWREPVDATGPGTPSWVYLAEAAAADPPVPPDLRGSPAPVAVEPVVDGEAPTPYVDAARRAAVVVWAR